MEVGGVAVRARVRVRVRARVRARVWARVRVRVRAHLEGSDIPVYNVAKAVGGKRPTEKL